MSNLLDSLRAKLRDENIQAVIIPMNDPHLSEYVAAHWQAIEWLTGFTGSAGTIVVTEDHAGLWTDSRYFLQGEEELAGSGFTLEKLRIPHTPEYLEWLCETLPGGSIVGIDGRLISQFSLEKMKERFADDGLQIRTYIDVLSDLWTDRQPLPKDEIFELPAEFAGNSTAEKLEGIRVEIQKQKADYHLLTALDDIAWTFNLRGADVDFNPVFYAWAIIGKDSANLFVDPDKVPQEVAQALWGHGVVMEAYTEIHPALGELAEGSALLLDPKKTASALVDDIPEHCRVIEGDSIPEKLKAIKNETEIDNVRGAMARDGVALLKLYRWLENQAGKPGVTEAAVAEKLDEFRAEGDHYAGESFPAIAGFKGNGAIVHYRPDPESSAQIEAEGMFLLDSGGQYLDGTTDVTRTTIFGTPTRTQQFHFTLVLKGMIGVTRCRFRAGTAGANLDILAREHLWRHGLNYGHGTGHGVGAFLNVHEGPQGISSGLTGRAAVPLQAGMITSNEPGYYLEGEYGIRIENLVLCRESEIGEGFLEFETLTLFPIDHNLIDAALLTQDEKNWLNEYHDTVQMRLSPLLNAEEQAWLAEKCKAIR